ncbi:MAG: serine hydrolase domain-containing protein [Faecousia sp.]
MFETVTDILTEAIEQKATPGVAAAIGCGNEILYERCFGRLSYGEDAPVVTLETQYDMASVTKILCTTMLCLQALGEGRIYLQDPVSLFFPEAPADKWDITLFQLLTHTSGIDPHFFLWDYVGGKEHPAEVILNHTLICKPGTEVRYSCMGFILLGKILEKIYDAPIDELFQKRVANPLGLKRTGYCPADLRNIAPTEYDTDGRLLQGCVHDENARFQNGVSANAGIFSTIKDMEVFVRTLACGGTAPNGTQLIPPRCLEKAITNYTKGMAENRGLGFKLYGGSANFMGDLFPDAAFGHTGYTGTGFAVDPETGFYIILLANRVHPTRDQTRWLRIRRLVHNAAAAEFYRGDKRLV